MEASKVNCMKLAEQVNMLIREIEWAADSEEVRGLDGVWVEPCAVLKCAEADLFRCLCSKNREEARKYVERSFPVKREG